MGKYSTRPMNKVFALRRLTPDSLNDSCISPFRTQMNTVPRNKQYLNKQILFHESIDGKVTTFTQSFQLLGSQIRMGHNLVNYNVIIIPQ